MLNLNTVTSKNDKKTWPYRMLMMRREDPVLLDHIKDQPHLPGHIINPFWFKMGTKEDLECTSDIRD